MDPADPRHRWQAEDEAGEAAAAEHEASADGASADLDRNGEDSCIT